MSSTSLYGTTGNVTVSANNLTTLYNAQPGNVVTANVPDRNFTTLYATSPSQVSPTKPYGNANVEAFLNAGTDGANIVDNINMHGTLTVGGLSNLGNVGNVHITGGSSGYVLTTNGLGNLIWQEPQGGGGNVVPYIHFNVTSNGNNQSFIDTNIGFYTSTDQMAVMKNGINIEPSLYTVVGDTLTINILLASGDTIDVLPSGGGGGGGTPAGIPGAVQYNDGYNLAGSDSFTFDSGSNTVSIANLTVTDTTNLNDVGNIYIGGGTSNSFLRTDGAGNLSWQAVSVTSVNHANYADVANSVAGSNVSGTVSNASYAVYVTNNAQPNINSLGTLTGLTSTGTINFNGASNVTLGSVSNVHLGGGVTGYVLSTDGAGNLSWIAGGGGGGGTSISNGSSNVNIATAGGNITFGVGGVANIMTVSNTAVVITGTTTIQQGIEKVTANATGSTGTVNFDILTQAILNKTANASANFTVNLRGNSTVTLDTVMSSSQSMTCTYINKKNTGTPYVLSALNIDSVAQTVYWVNGANPTTNAYLYDIYTFNVLKTSSNTYTVFGTFGSYN